MQATAKMETTDSGFSPKFNIGPNFFTSLTFGLVSVVGVVSTAPQITIMPGDVAMNSSSLQHTSSALKLYIVEQLKEKNRTRYRKVKASTEPEPDRLSINIVNTLDLLASQKIDPDYVNSTEDGGFTIEFTKSGVYNLIEFFQDGEIAFLQRKGNEIDAWDLHTDNFLEELSEKIV